MMEQALERGRRAIKRHCEPLAHNGHRHIDAFDATQDIGNEVTALEACGVPAIGHLVVGRSVDVIEDGTWYPAPSQSSKVVEVMTVTQAHMVFVHPLDANATGYMAQCRAVSAKAARHALANLSAAVRRGA